MSEVIAVFNGILDFCRIIEKGGKTMIWELDRSEFTRCRHLLNPQGQLEAVAVVEGANPGRIFVDDRMSPTSGMIWLGNNDGFLFMGNEQNELFNQEVNSFIDSVIVPEAKKLGLEWFEALGNHDKWYGTIERVFAHRNLGSWNQRVYRLKSDDYHRSNEPEIEEGYEVVKINADLLENKTAINASFLRTKIDEFWSTPGDFINKGIGCCIVHQREVVSVCFSGFVVGNIHCIDIETVREHRGKKLAKKIAHCFVKDCLNHGQVPYWDCMEVNKPSVAVVESLGFQITYRYVGYEFRID
jgi:hypothetical protein